MSALSSPSLTAYNQCLDKTSADTPVAAGSWAFTGELGRQMGDGAEGRKEEKRRESSESY